jgi:flagellar protein FlaF
MACSVFVTGVHGKVTRMADKPTVQFKNKREMDAAAFSQAAYVLDQAKQSLTDKDLCERALKYNQLLWSIIQSDVAKKNNQLPDEIKANLMSLSIFVDKQTSKGITNPTAEVFDSLININLNISEGLMEGAK